MTYIWLDDIRAPPDGWKHVKTVAEAIAELESGDVEIISLDHDLGEDQPPGYDVLVYIEECVANNSGYKPPVMKIHSANNVGRQRMQQAINSIIRFSTNHDGIY